MSDTVIDASTILAYRETEYRVHGDEPFILRIGQACDDLAAIHRRHGVTCSAYLTACNPHSQRLDDAANARRQAELGDGLRQRHRTAFEGLGLHPSNGWPGEPSFLVLGLTLEESRSLGHRFGQDAIVWSGPDAVPQLILLR